MNHSSRNEFRGSERGRQSPFGQDRDFEERGRFQGDDYQQRGRGEEDFHAGSEESRGYGRDDGDFRGGGRSRGNYGSWQGGQSQNREYRGGSQGDYGFGGRQGYGGGYGAGMGGGRDFDRGQDRDFNRGYGSDFDRGGSFGNEQNFGGRGGQDWNRSERGGFGRGSEHGNFQGYGGESGAYGSGSGNWQSRGFEGRGTQGSGMRQNRGPKGYTRSDERIKEDVCERLSQRGDIDVDEVSIDVQGGKITLQGTVPDRRMKHMIEDIACGCMGVKDVENKVSVSSGDRDQESRSGSNGSRDDQTQQSKSRKQ
jgi:hypothetical protein